MFVTPSGISIDDSPTQPENAALQIIPSAASIVTSVNIPAEDEKIEAAPNLSGIVTDLTPPHPENVDGDEY